MQGWGEKVQGGFKQLNASRSKINARTPKVLMIFKALDVIITTVEGHIVFLLCGI